MLLDVPPVMLQCEDAGRELLYVVTCVENEDDCEKSMFRPPFPPRTTIPSALPLALSISVLSILLSHSSTPTSLAAY